MACALWSARTPGAAMLERDRVMMNNKKKVRRRVTYRERKIVIKNNFKGISRIWGNRG